MAVKDKQPERGLTYDEVAERLSVRPRQVQRWCDERKLGYVELPQGRRILESHLAAFIAANAVEPVA